LTHAATSLHVVCDRQEHEQSRSPRTMGYGVAPRPSAPFTYNKDITIARYRIEYYRWSSLIWLLLTRLGECLIVIVCKILASLF